MSNILFDLSSALCSLISIHSHLALFPSIPQIDLTRNKLGPEGGKAIAKGIQNSRSLTAIGKNGLNLKDNNFGDEGWGAIFAAVCGSSKSKIASIDASRERIGVEGAKMIGQALKSSVSRSLTQVLALLLAIPF